ncbi:GntR family transcriptional regulator [Bradyrhizobium sp. STM 3557]|uniref:GntR family transcriptional regulator n=1 Tax=Bradyrhizobium sp. STM 3557 TaxID=578920 RepID=UPI00388E683A
MNSTIPDEAVAAPTETSGKDAPGRDEVSLHDEILSRLRDYIVEGNIPDGARISERQLCEMLKVSRTPLREALKVLAAEGLLELLPNRGARVRPLSADDIRELFDLMGGLEGLAGRLACERISDEEIEKIEQLHHDMYGFYMRREMQGYFRMNQLIHHAIVEAAGNAALRTTYESLAGRIRRVRFSANFAHQRERWSEAMREHEAILEALRRRSGSELSDSLFQHLRNKGAAAISYLTEPDAAPAPATSTRLARAG